VNPATIAALTPFLLVFCRSAAFLYSAPLVGDHGVPGRLRVATAVMMAAGLGSAAPSPSAGAPGNLDALFAHIPLELLIGLGVGLLLKVALASVEAGGQLVGVHLELSFAASYDPRLAEEALPTRRIAAVLLGVTFLSAGGLEASIAFVARARASEQLLTSIGSALFTAGDQVMRGALSICGPVLLATLVANVAVGIAGRASPALNVFSVMLAGTLLIGGFAISASAPMTCSAIKRVAEGAISRVLTLPHARPPLR